MALEGDSELALVSQDKFMGDQPSMEDARKQ
jgi:hypothetical protein